MHFAWSKIGLDGISASYHSIMESLAKQDGELSNKTYHVVMVKMWLRRLYGLRLDMTTAGVFEL